MNESKVLLSSGSFLSYPPGYYSYKKARRRRQEEKNAFEAKVQEMKRKDVEAEG